MAPKRSHLVDKAIQFCCEIATLFEINKAYVTYRVPNFIKYSTDCSTSKMSHFKKDYMFSILAYKIGKDTAKNVFEFMKTEILQDIENSDSGERKSLHRALNKFFNEKNEIEKKKFLIRLSGLIPTYLISHKPYMKFWKDEYVVCNELFFLKYIYELAMEMLRPCLINFTVDKYKKLKLEPAYQYEQINNSMDIETTIKENGGNTSIMNDGET